MELHALSRRACKQGLQVVQGLGASCRGGESSWNGACRGHGHADDRWHGRWGEETQWIRGCQAGRQGIFGSCALVQDSGFRGRACSKQGLHGGLVQALHPGELRQAGHVGQRSVAGNDIDFVAQGHDLQALARRFQSGKVLPLGLERLPIQYLGKVTFL